MQPTKRCLPTAVRTRLTTTIKTLSASLEQAPEPELSTVFGILRNLGTNATPRRKIKMLSTLLRGNAQL
jgi:hypothetical protein